MALNLQDLVMLVSQVPQGGPTATASGPNSGVALSASNPGLAASVLGGLGNLGGFFSGNTMGVNVGPAGLAVSPVGLFGGALGLVANAELAGLMGQLNAEMAVPNLGVMSPTPQTQHEANFGLSNVSPVAPMFSSFTTMMNAMFGRSDQGSDTSAGVTGGGAAGVGVGGAGGVAGVGGVSGGVAGSVGGIGDPSGGSDGPGVWHEGGPVTPDDKPGAEQTGKLLEGEYVVKAEPAKKYRKLLDAINKDEPKKVKSLAERVSGR